MTFSITAIYMQLHLGRYWFLQHCFSWTISAMNHLSYFMHASTASPLPSFFYVLATTCNKSVAVTGFPRWHRRPMLVNIKCFGCAILDRPQSLLASEAAATVLFNVRRTDATRHVIRETPPLFVSRCCVSKCAMDGLHLSNCYAPLNNWTQYSALSSYHGWFFLRITHKRHPIARARQGEMWVSIASARSDWSFTILNVVLCALSSYIWPRYIESPV